MERPEHCRGCKWTCVCICPVTEKVMKKKKQTPSKEEHTSEEWDWETEFKDFFVSIGGGTALNTREEVVSQKANILNWVKELLKKEKEKSFTKALELAIGKKKEVGDDDYREIPSANGYNKKREEIIK